MSYHVDLTRAELAHLARERDDLAAKVNALQVELEAAHESIHHLQARAESAEAALDRDDR